MHKETVSNILVSEKTGFIISISVDGVVKFWNKCVTGIEFVKAYKAFKNPVAAAVVSHDGQRLLISCSEEKSIKLFDIANFDLIIYIFYKKFVFSLKIQFKHYEKLIITYYSYNLQVYLMTYKGEKP